MDAIKKTLNRWASAVHVWLYRRTNGKIGARMEGFDVLLLTTIGRKTGKTRVLPLVYLPDGDGYLILASAAGTPTPPGWYWNATAGSSPVSIQINDMTTTVDVAELEGDAREAAYTKYKQHIGVERIELYERRSNHRVFPILRLTPQK